MKYVILPLPKLQKLKEQHEVWLKTHAGVHAVTISNNEHGILCLTIYHTPDLHEASRRAILRQLGDTPLQWIEEDIYMAAARTDKILPT